jgi:hypothetical protein
MLVLTERERRALARIERHLSGTDPALARLLATGSPPPSRWTSPTVLLAAGLALFVLGCLLSAVPLAVAGIGLAVTALFTAHRCPRLYPA